MKTTVKTLAELEAEAVRLVGRLAPQEDCATLITFSGDLGAGKTAFAQAIARVLGVEENVTSPTFVLEKIYKLGHPMSKFNYLIHIDAYRLEAGSDLAPLGFDELMRDAGNLVVLEWPEKVIDALPVPTVRISIAIRQDDSRMITYG